MSNNINKNQVFQQISELQNNMSSIKEFLFYTSAISETQSCVEREDEEPVVLEYSADVAKTKIDVIREVVMQREKTINKMLDFYLKLYQDLEKGEKE